MRRGLRARRRRRFHPRTTDSSHAGPFSPNRLARAQAPAAPDQVWASDITYLATGEGWLFLATVLDLFSRRVLGWATQENLEATLVVRALGKALAWRRPLPGLVVHSDRASQYASKQVRQLLEKKWALASMSRPANCYDNAFQESFFASMKRETGLGRAAPKTRREAELAIFDYIETFYNPTQLHSSHGYQSPAEYELKFYQSQNDAA